MEGVLAATVDSDFPDPADGHSFNGLIAIYTSGRFIFPAVREANPSFVFDPTAINTLKAKGITFEATLGLWQPVDPGAVKMSELLTSILLLAVTLLFAVVSGWRASH